MGSSGPLSVIPLQALLDHGQTVVAVALEADNKPGPWDQRFPILNGTQGSIESLARLQGIPVITLSGLWSQSVDEISRYSADMIVVSCFGRKLPDSVLSIPRIACFNLHPSLLPAYRGPVPLFWQFRAGVTEFGITLHRMSTRFDAGNIIANTRVAMPDGVSGQRAGELLAEAGSKLLLKRLSKFTGDEVIGSPQDERCASYQGFPSPSDYAVSVSWSAKRVYNFVRATCHRGVLYPCRVGSRVYSLLAVDSWRETDDSGVVINGNSITIPCRRGSVTARFQAD